MTNIFTQDGELAFSVNSVDELRAEITHTTHADYREKHFYLVELTRELLNYEDLNQQVGITAYCALYRFRVDAENELLRLWRTITGGKCLDNFTFAKSDIMPLELVRLRTAFI